MAPVFRFNNLMFRYYETFRYGCCSRFIMCDNGFYNIVLEHIQILLTISKLDTI